MLIESIIRRPAAKTVVTLGKAPNARTYTFAPTKTDPRHVCDVTNEDDAQTFLAIKEGYRIPKAAASAAVPKPAAKPALAVTQGKNGKWFLTSNGKPIGADFAEKSDADAALAAAKKADGE